MLAARVEARDAVDQEDAVRVVVAVDHAELRHVDAPEDDRDAAVERGLDVRHRPPAGGVVRRRLGTRLEHLGQDAHPLEGCAVLAGPVVHRRPSPASRCRPWSGGRPGRRAPSARSCPDSGSISPAVVSTPSAAPMKRRPAHLQARVGLGGRHRFAPPAASSGLRYPRRYDTACRSWPPGRPPGPSRRRRRRRWPPAARPPGRETSAQPRPGARRGTAARRQQRGEEGVGVVELAGDPVRAVVAAVHYVEGARGRHAQPGHAWKRTGPGQRQPGQERQSRPRRARGGPRAPDTPVAVSGRRSGGRRATAMPSSTGSRRRRARVVLGQVAEHATLERA